MKKVILMVPDSRMTLLEELVQAIDEMEIVEVTDWGEVESFQRKTPMERLNFALRGVVAEQGVLAYRYDYAWLYAMIQQDELKGIERFQSVESFRQYLINIGIKDVPSNSTISDRYGCLRHKYPDWTFTDSHDALETKRRINVAKRFLCLFMKGK